MIIEDIFNIEGKEYDRRIFPSDWRYSASILGMYLYFESMDIPYHKDEVSVYYKYKTVSPTYNDRYAEYVEKTYWESLHHTILEQTILKKDKEDDDISLIKEKLSANAVMKRIFKKKDADQEDEILELIDTNRQELILETFKNGMFGYRKYANPNRFRTESDRSKVCRLNGYYVDAGRKTKAISFSFDNKTRKFNDHIEFDFIPFAFTRNREAIFINNNFSIDRLINANYLIADQLTGEDFRSKLFFATQKGAEYIDYDVEVIVKDQDKEHFETMFIRKESLKIFAEIRNLNSNNDYINKALSFSIRIKDDYYLNVMKEATEKILNLSVLDGLILTLMKLDPPQGFIASQLIRINRLIYKRIYYGGEMEHNQKQENFLFINAGNSAKAVKKHFREKKIKHKLDTYRNKLISALAARDSRRVNDIMLQLSSYAQVDFQFMHVIFRDFDKHVNLLYHFTNQLNYFSENDEKETKEDGDE